MTKMKRHSQQAPLTTASPPTTPPPQQQQQQQQHQQPPPPPSPTTPQPPPKTPPRPSSPITSFPRLATPPRGNVRTPTSHRRNRHAPPPLHLAPMIATSRGVVTLNTLPGSPVSPTTQPTTAEIKKEGLAVIGEGEEEEEEGDGTKREEGAVKKIRFEDDKSDKSKNA